MKKGFAVFPHQLFKDNLHLSKDISIYLIEDHLYFSQYAFNKQKLILHRASMKYYEDLLRSKDFKVTYISYDVAKDMETVVKIMAKDGITELQYRDVTDDWLGTRLEESARKHKIKTTVLTTPMFLCTNQYLHEYFGDKKRYLMADFYVEQRKRFGILMQDGKPMGGRWSYDADNRKKLPKKIKIPATWFPSSNHYVEDAKAYVQQHFPNHPGSLEFHYAVTHADARKCLRHFIRERFDNFGAYEDAIDEKETFLYHSVISLYLNTGLLTPEEVIEMVLSEENIPLNSLEGYLRQIVGWREYMRAVYVLKGRRDRTFNFWEHHKKIPYSFWTGTTGIEPVDKVIGRVVNNGYTHHIERLMVMGNFMLLCEFDPDEIYRWFMEMYIDAYDWVMVPNVYSMSQYASGGTTTTKPYISSSNYLLKMSNFKKGAWCEVWDALYWRFIHHHKDFFSKNQRLGMMTAMVDKMGKEKISMYTRRADQFLQQLT